jgi:hypothetical protein
MSFLMAEGKVGNPWRMTREAIEEFTGLPWKE